MSGSGVASTEVAGPATTTPPTVPPPTSPPPRSRRWVTPVVAIVVAAVVIVGVLFAAGVLFHKSSTPGTSEPYATFDEAASAAGSVTSRGGSGTWSPALAIGLRVASSITLPLANLSALTNLSSNCNVTTVSGAPLSITIDTTPASAGPGHDAFWLIGFLSGGSLLLVSVDLGTPAALYTLSGGGCTEYTSALVAFPSSEVDSPTLVANANGSGGSAFLAANPSAAQVLAGVGGINIGLAITPPIWGLLDTACPVPLLINETEPDFNATLTGSGQVLAHESSSANCALGLGDLSSRFTLVAGPLLAESKAI